MEGARSAGGIPSSTDKVDRGRKASASIGDLRTPIVENILSLVPSGHEKPVKYAFYQILALVLSSGIVLAFYGVFRILEPFIKSLLWALLVGSVLHPFKGNLRSYLLSWLKDVRRSPTPFAVKVAASPLVIVDSFSDQIGNYVVTFWKSIISAIAAFFVTYIVYYNPPTKLALFGQFVVTTMYKIFAWCLSWINGPVVLALNVIYLGYVIHFFNQRRQNDSVTSSESSKPRTEKGTDETITADEIDTTTSEQSPKKEPSGAERVSETASNPLAPEPIGPNPDFIKGLSYLCWGITFAYICLKLPYSLLIPLIVFIVLGAVTYLRGRNTSSTHLTIPSISRYACMVVLNIGREKGSASTTASNSRIVSPRPSVDTRRGDSLTSPTAESSHVMESRGPGNLQRSWSEGSGELLAKPKSLSDANKTEDTIREDAFPSEMPSPIYSDCGVDEVEGSALDSNKFLYWVFCACVVVQIWNHLWVLRLAPIPLIYFFLKKLCWRMGIVRYWRRNIQKPFERFYSDVNGPSGYIFPAPIRIAFQILRAGDRKFVSICETYVDPVTSLVVLIFVVMATILGLIFAASQVYAEGDHLVRVGVNLINSTVSQHPEINEILPEGWMSVMDSMAENAYVYGREYITNMIRDSISEKNPDKAEILEKQVIEIWDRLYMSFNQTWSDNGKISGSDVAKDAGTKSVEWDAILETGKEVPELLEISVIINYAKANVGTLWSVFESVWNILVGNISLALSAVTSFVSVMFGGGTALLNLVINFVVFFTALFYLLSSSTLVYKPVELFNIWMPGSGNGIGNSFALAVEEAISGVFVASLKMGTFYGMWTWLIHTLFQVNIVFIPSMFAALLGAVPFLMPYWAAFPAVLELWLIQGHWPKALLMFLAQMAPMSAVDTQIYSEIKGGGHPYLTGLAVAGGIFCFGAQGSVLGPVVLACVFVVIKVTGTFMREEPVSDIIGQREPSFSKHNRPVLHRNVTEELDSLKSFNLTSPS